MLLFVSTILALGALILPIALRPSQYPIQVGAVAGYDITAPYSAQFNSQVLTDQANRKICPSHCLLQ